LAQVNRHLTNDKAIFPAQDITLALHFLCGEKPRVSLMLLPFVFDSINRWGILPRSSRKTDLKPIRTKQSQNQPSQAFPSQTKPQQKPAVSPEDKKATQDKPRIERYGNRLHRATEHSQSQPALSHQMPQEANRFALQALLSFKGKQQLVTTVKTKTEPQSPTKPEPKTQTPRSSCAKQPIYNYN
jgi:hypothetical protein